MLKIKQPNHLYSSTIYMPETFLHKKQNNIDIKISPELITRYYWFKKFLIGSLTAMLETRNRIMEITPRRLM